MDAASRSCERLGRCPAALAEKHPAPPFKCGVQAADEVEAAPVQIGDDVMPEDVYGTGGAAGA